MNYNEAIKELEKLSNPTFKNIKGMARFGIKPKTKLLCVPVPKLRKLAKKIGKNHNLALKLWDSKMHEARILASIITEPEKLTEKQMDKWVKDFDTWDICDQTCMNLFGKSDYALKKIKKWSNSKDEFVKRTAFSLIAVMAVHNKEMKNEKFLEFFKLIKKASTDERNFVRKAVNWALRQIGKRNLFLNKNALQLADEILKINSKSAKWIASDAIRELNQWKIRI